MKKKKEKLFAKLRCCTVRSMGLPVRIEFPNKGLLIITPCEMPKL